MKNQTHRNLAARSSTAVALVLAFGSLVHAQSVMPAETKPAVETIVMERCQEMSKQKQKLEEDAKAQDAQLTEQLAAMNRAPEDKKLAMMAAILTQMSEQRIAMDARKSKMQEMMMQQMMMQMGKDSTSQCPMMMGMMDMSEKSKGAHKEHQEEQK